MVTKKSRKVRAVAKGRRKLKARRNQKVTLQIFTGDTKSTVLL